MIKHRKFSILVEQLGIKPVDIIKYMSANSDDVPDLLIDMASDELARLSKEQSQMVYYTMPANLKNDKLSIKNTEFIVGNEVFEMLNNIDSVVVFACTVSAGLNKKLHEYSNPEQMTEAYIADIAGTIIIEKSLELIYQELQIQTQKSDLNITNTISPGNCGWAVEEQKKLFSLLPDNCLGISLNDSGMMNPVKSLSGIVGVGKKVKFIHTDCEQCSSKNCLYRKSPERNKK